jgi:type VI protein secretion system component VasK
MSKTHIEFRNKIIRNIRLWAVLAAVLLTVGVIYVAAVWLYGSAELFEKSIIVAPGLMLIVTVAWWGWTVRTISTLIDHWNETRDDIEIVVDEIKEIKQLVREIISIRKDK